MGNPNSPSPWFGDIPVPDLETPVRGQECPRTTELLRVPSPLANKAMSPAGIEPARPVLETSVLPLNYGLRKSPRWCPTPPWGAGACSRFGVDIEYIIDSIPAICKSQSFSCATCSVESGSKFPHSEGWPWGPSRKFTPRIARPASPRRRGLFPPSAFPGGKSPFFGEDRRSIPRVSRAAML